MSVLVLSSSNQYLQLLKESDSQIKVIGLQKLVKVVDYHWPEIANYLSDIQRIFEDETFNHRTLAAFLASKIFYHLEEYSDAVNYALEAWDDFVLADNGPYAECMISKAIDRYIKNRQHSIQDAGGSMEDENEEQNFKKLERVVLSILDKQIQAREFKLALGICLEARRSDKVQEILKLSEQHSSQHTELLSYICDLALHTVQVRAFRNQILNFIVEAYDRKQLQAIDYINLSQIYFQLGQYKPLAHLLQKLNFSEQETELLLSYQIAYDISENENRYFISNLISELPLIQQDDQNQTLKRNRLLAILNGYLTEELNLMFSINNNRSDPLVIKNLKSSTDAKNSVAHQAVVLANYILQSGTTNDSFLRDHFDWIKTATHWAKFSIVSSLGSIHKGNHSQAMQLLQPYFPQNTPNPNWYAHGGSLLALGMIFNKSKDQKTINFILDAIKSPQNNQNEQIIHGACLGLGLVGMASDDRVLLEEIKNILFTNQATTGEAAGLAIGLIMAGSADQDIISEILQYAKETDHEKIIRSITLSLAMIMFGREDVADALIDQLCTEKDPILRYGGVFMIGLAYVGTANNRALRKLLHFASADVADEVRRAAVISIAFLMLNDPEQMPKIANLLITSYNPHVRYGAALALGIACAGTGQSEALNLLEPMLKDTVDFVRQGAFLGMAMVLQQVTEKMEPKVDTFKKYLKEITSKKHEDILCRLGAILATGIIEAGGRNSIINLVSRSGSLKMGACLGMLIFTNHWYWFPCVNFLSLALSPSALIGVNSRFQVPKGFEVACNAKPSLFDYPENLKDEAAKKQEKTQATELSITAKAKARQAKREQEKDNKMEIEDQNPKTQEKQTPPEKLQEKLQEVIEPESYTLQNPARILDKQKQYLQFIPSNRYTPLLSNRKKGIVFLIDNSPDQADNYFQQTGKASVTQQVVQSQQSQIVQQQQQQQQSEVLPPEPFIFDEEAQKE